MKTIRRAWEFIKRNALKILIVYLVFMVVVNTFGPIIFSLNDWDNYIQWVSGYEIGFAVFGFFLHVIKVHERLDHLHAKIDQKKGATVK